MYHSKQLDDYCRFSFLRVRGQSDKYSASLPDGVTIAREIYYRVLHSRSRLLTKSMYAAEGSRVDLALSVCPDER